MSEQTNAPASGANADAITAPKEFQERIEISRQYQEYLEGPYAALEALVNNMTVFGAIITAIVVVVSGFGAYRLQDIRKNIEKKISEASEQAKLEAIAGAEEAAEVAIQKTSEEELKKYRGLIQSLDDLKVTLKTWNDIKDTVNQLAIVQASKHLNDPYKLYEKIDKLAKSYEQNKGLSDEQREEALRALKQLIVLGASGEVPANTLFNASADASRLAFEYAAFELVALAQHFDPSDANTSRLMRQQHIFGRRLTVNREQKTLDVTTDKPEQVRDDSWQHALSLAADLPLLNGEIMLQEAHNIAMRRRESGSHTQYAERLQEAIADAGDRQVISYVYLTLAHQYLLAGESNWRDKVRSNLIKALQTLAGESPAATWYKHTLGEWLSVTASAGILEDIRDALAERGIDLDKIREEAMERQRKE